MIGFNRLLYQCENFFYIFVTHGKTSYGNTFSMDHDNWLSAWTGNKPDELIQFYDSEAYYQDPANPNGLKGEIEILPYFTKLLAKYPTWVWKCEELFPIEKGVVLKWKSSIPVNGQTKELTGLDIVEIVDQKITRNEVYFDTSLMR